MTDTLNMEDLRGRTTVSVPEAGALLGLSKNTSYQAAKNGDIPVLKIGHRLVVPVPRLLALLEGEGANDAA